MKSPFLPRPLRHVAPVFCSALALLAGTVQAQPVQVQDAWVRSTVPGQKGTGAFMRLTSPVSTRLVAVSSPVAGVVEVHAMRVENNVMKMTPLPDGLELPAGQPVELKPGSYHIMLMDLPRALTPGNAVPLTLVFRDARGQEQRLEVKAPVSAVAPSMPASHPH